MIDRLAPARVLLLVAATLVGSLAPVTAQGMYDTAAFRTFEITFPTNDWLLPLINSKLTETYLKADLKFDGKLYKDVGVRSRGGSAYTAGKRNGKLPLKISFEEFVPDRKVLGVRSTVLNNGYWSPTFMREVLILGLMRKFVPAPEANFCQVTINGQNHGVYINVETPNKDFVRRHYFEEDGNRYKGRTVLGYWGTSTTSYSSRYPLASAATPNAYQDLIAALQTTTYIGGRAEIEIPKLCNVEGGLKNLACNVAFANGDSFPRHNYYIYMDPHHNQMEIIPWDVNLGFRRTTISLIPAYYGQSLLWQRWFVAHIRDIGETSLDWNEISKDVFKWQALIDQAVQNDPKKFYTYADFKNGIFQSASIFPGLKPTIEGLQQTIKNTLNAPRVALTDHLRTPVDPKPTDTVWIRVTAKSTGFGVNAVNLHWRSVGHYQSLAMFDDGNHNDGLAGDGIYGVAVPFRATGAQIEYYFSAEEKNLAISFLPIETDYRPFRYRHLGPTLGSVLIHEIMASNTKVIQDEKGDYDDWIELFNPKTIPVDVGGMYLSDDSANVKKWQIPAGISIPARGTLVVWADDEPTEGPLHATFKLSITGEEVFLTDKDGTTLLDFAEFGTQLSDVSLARLHDSADPVRVTDFTPTPGVRNEVPSCGVRRFAAQDYAAQTIGLGFTGTPKIATQVSFDITGAPPNAGLVLLVGGAVQSFYLQPLDIRVLVDSVVLSVGLPGSATGAVSLPLTIPNDPNLHGLQLAVQALSAAGGRVFDSNAVQIELCR